MVIKMDNESSLPKYVLIRESIRNEILKGKDEGMHFTVMEIAARFGVNRLTARHAIEGLIQEGIIRSIKGVGLFASPPQQIIENIDEPSNYIYRYSKEGRNATIKTRKMEWIRAVDEVSSNLMIREDTKVLFLERLRTADDVPLTLDYKYIRLPWASVITESKLQTGVLRKILEAETTGVWTGMSNQIEAIGASPEIASCLNIMEGSPVVLRKTVLFGKDKSEAIIFGISFYRADRFKWQSYIEF
jgi:GntR family transcriptional regulator